MAINDQGNSLYSSGIQSFSHIAARFDAVQMQQSALWRVLANSRHKGIGIALRRAGLESRLPGRARSLVTHAPSKIGQVRPKAFDTFAVSRDLLHWTRWDGPDLVAPSEPWDDTYAHKPWLIKHDGVVYHFYCAVGSEGRVIALATSKDLRGE